MWILSYFIHRLSSSVHTHKHTYQISLNFYFSTPYGSIKDEQPQRLSHSFGLKAVISVTAHVLSVIYHFDIGKPIPFRNMKTIDMCNVEMTFFFYYVHLYLISWLICSEKVVHEIIF